jgi:16S rRNA (guanine527-N7)-methyltransferase
MRTADRRALEAVLAGAQRRGFLGPGPVAPHIDRALHLFPALAWGPRRALDLGSGGGLPGLPLALVTPGAAWVLLDGSRTRAGFLQQAVDRLGLAGRVEVIGERAETAGRGPLRGGFDLVVARGFAGPAATAECGAPFLQPGGRLIVAEPPGGQPQRWDPEGLAELGLICSDRMVRPTAYQILIQESPCPDRFPRRVGIPEKRPLF